MKQTVSNQMGDGQIVQQSADNETLSIIQAIFYACLGGFSIQEILDVQKQ